MENLIITGWIVCGVLVYGMVFGYFQNAYPNLAKSSVWQDRLAAILVGILGPAGLIGTFLFIYCLSQRGPQKMKF